LYTRIEGYRESNKLRQVIRASLIIQQEHRGTISQWPEQGETAEKQHSWPSGIANYVKMKGDVSPK